MPQRATEAIQPPHCERVPWAQVAQAGLRLEAMAMAMANRIRTGVGVDPGAPGRPQLNVLQRQILAAVETRA
jgi:hypothetical protein